MRYGIDGRYIQDHFPGIGRYTYNLIRRLAPLAPEDDIIVFYDPLAPHSEFDPSGLCEWPNVTLAPVRASPFSLRQQIALPSLARQQKLSLYHSPYYLFPYALRCATVVSLHDLIPLLYPERSRGYRRPRGYRRQIFALAAGLAVRRAEHIIVDSQATRLMVMERWSVPSERISAIPLAADDCFGCVDSAAVGRMREKLGLDGPYVLHVGTNKPHKNLPRLVEAWAGLPRDLQAAHTLVLAGPHDPRYPQARLQAERSGLHIRFLGRVSRDDLAALYAGAQAFVFPSLHEGFGLPVLEAMASGAPVACSNHPALPEVVGAAALLFDPEQAPDMAAALARLLTEPDLRADLARKGRERAASFSWARTAAETLRVYRGLVRREGAP